MRGIISGSPWRWLSKPKSDCVRLSTLSGGFYDTDHVANTYLQRLTVRSITWSRVERCSCQAVATRCQWLVPQEEISTNNLVSIRTFFAPTKADHLQTHAWAAVLRDTTRSATSAMHARSLGPTCKPFTPTSGMYLLEAQTRPNK